MENSVLRLCECESTSCTLTVKLPFEVALEVDRKGYAIIVKGCKEGPSPGEKLVRHEPGYDLYEPEKK